MPLPGNPVIGGFGSLIGGASASAGPIAGTLGAVNSGRTFISGLSSGPLAALVLFPGNIKTTRSAAVQPITTWMTAECGLFIFIVLSPNHTYEFERGSTPGSLIMLH
jgi:hypothetical protein